MPMPPAIPSRLVGMVCVMLAVTIFSVQDMVFKWFSDRYALHQLVFIRSCVAMLTSLAILVPLEGGYKNLLTKRWKMHLMRGVAIVFGNMFFFMGAAALPFSEAVAIFFVSPLIITLMAVPILGEKFSIHRFAAVITGLTGALIIIRPGGVTFQAAALLPLLAAIAYSSMQMMTRKLGLAEKASTMSFYIQVMFLSSSAAMGLLTGNGRFAGSDDPSMEFLLRAWSWPEHTDMLIICALGFFNAFGGYLISQGYRMSEASLVAPFEYVAIPLSVLWSVLIWSQWPDAYAWLGISLICGAGIYIALREARRKPDETPKIPPRTPLRR